MTENKPKYKRKTYFIQKMFQTKFIFLFLSLVILGSIISGIILYLRANLYLNYQYGMAHIQLQKTGEILRPALFISYGISIVLIGIATVVLTLFVSHKVAGPLYRFERSAEEVGKGNLTLITRIRESDQAKGLADAFSRMTMDLRTKLQEIDLRSTELNRMIEDINKIMEQKRPNLDKIKEKFKELEQRSKELCQSLQYFKL